MTMGRYEEVRDRATEVMTQQAMANAAMQAGKIDEALDYATAGADIAEKILKEYEDIGASYVVYCNATGFRFQLLDAIKDYQNAFLQLLLLSIQLAPILLNVWMKNIFVVYSLHNSHKCLFHSVILWNIKAI